MGKVTWGSSEAICIELVGHTRLVVRMYIIGVGMGLLKAFGLDTGC